MHKKSIFSLVLLVILLLTGCASRAFESASDFAGAPMEPAYEGEVFAEESTSTQNGMTIADSTDVSQAERVVIKNASIRIIVDDPGSVLDTIGRMAEESGGFIVTSNLFRTQTSQGLEIPGAEITVRVPAEQLNDILDQIKALLTDPEKDVMSENITGEDVTSEYTDLQSRLKNLEVAQERLEEIMDNAQETEDVLAVYNELTAVNEQIEILKGKIQYYNEAARLSSIAVTIAARDSIRELSIGGWKPAGIARNAIQALIDTLEFLGGAAIWVGLYFIPVGLCIFIPLFLIFLVVRSIIRRRKARTAQKEEADSAVVTAEDRE